MSNLKAGTYSIVATDNQGCKSNNLEVTITQAEKLKANLIASDTILCPGEVNGFLSIGLSGGTADPAAWEAEVARIYDPARMKAGFDAALAQALGGDATTIAAAQAFFAPARGQKILGLELEARRALLDDAVEAAARDAARQMQEDGAPRHDLLRRFADTNDLVELNVMGALNANLAFYKGLSRDGAFDQPMSESDMLAEVWGQEADVRVETDEWLWPYLSLAYGPLSDEELQAYIGFSGSDAGQRLNAAIFAAFDALFNDISMQLGLAAARQLQGQDI